MDPEAVKQALGSSGLRCTPQRYAVMAFLMEHNSHPTAAEIFDAVNRVDHAHPGRQPTTICGTW